MRYTRFSIFLGGFFTIAACACLAPLAAITSYAYQPLSIVLMPFAPADEIVLQAAIATEDVGASTDDERLKLLPGIEIRTKLEDYQRLHYELG